MIVMGRLGLGCSGSSVVAERGGRYVFIFQMRYRLCSALDREIRSDTKTHSLG
jgi:hypothetical protein